MKTKINFSVFKTLTVFELQNVNGGGNEGEPEDILLPPNKGPK